MAFWVWNSYSSTFTHSSWSPKRATWRMEYSLTSVIFKMLNNYFRKNTHTSSTPFFKASFEREFLWIHFSFDSMFLKHFSSFLPSNKWGRKRIAKGLVHYEANRRALSKVNLTNLDNSSMSLTQGKTVWHYYSLLGGGTPSGRHNNQLLSLPIFLKTVL